MAVRARLHATPSEQWTTNHSTDCRSSFDQSQDSFLRVPGFLITLRVTKAWRVTFFWLINPAINPTHATAVVSILTCVKCVFVSREHPDYVGPGKLWRLCDVWRILSPEIDRKLTMHGREWEPMFRAPRIEPFPWGKKYPWRALAPLILQFYINNWKQENCGLDIWPVKNILGSNMVHGSRDWVSARK